MPALMRVACNKRHFDTFSRSAASSASNKVQPGGRRVATAPGSLTPDRLVQFAVGVPSGRSMWSAATAWPDGVENIQHRRGSLNSTSTERRDAQPWSRGYLRRRPVAFRARFWRFRSANMPHAFIEHVRPALLSCRRWLLYAGQRAPTSTTRVLLKTSKSPVEFIAAIGGKYRASKPVGL
ncbi:hypothetical protein KCP75_00595 [Salmonella enterica subsp. enterica]|nr:hypothetical protein KCP75_00595 [Salmonella enterica subsp. enterica]